MLRILNTTTFGAQFFFGILSFLLVFLVPLIYSPLQQMIYNVYNYGRLIGTPKTKLFSSGTRYYIHDRLSVSMSICQFVSLFCRIVQILLVGTSGKISEDGSWSNWDPTYQKMCFPFTVEPKLSDLLLSEFSII